MDKNQQANGKTYYQYSLPDFFNLYKDRTELKDKIDKKKYKDFLMDFFAVIFKEIVLKKWTFYIPNRLGFLTLTSSKSGLKRPTDKGRTTNDPDGKRYVHLNTHSYGRVHTIKWVKKFVRFPNSKYYRYQTWKSTHAYTEYGAGSKAIWKMITDASKDPNTKLLP